MSVYRPKRHGDASKFYVCEFLIHGKRIQESTGTTSKTVAKEYEKRRRAELERAAVGLPTEQKAAKIRSVEEVVNAYVEGYRLSHRPSSIAFVIGRVAQIKLALGTVLLSDLNEDRIKDYIRKDYIRKRKLNKASGRTINMELGELSRALGHTWRELWPSVKKMEERKDVGKALSPDEQRCLLDGLESSQSPTLRTLVPVLLLTGMRAGEAISLRWRQVDLMNRAITVGRAKTSSGTGRVIPINDDLARVFSEHRLWFTERFGEPTSEHCVFPFGHPVPLDPFRPVTDVTWAWDGLRERSGVKCRLHDLRHTFATGLAERGVPESTMLALMGHMSRSMLERYSHIRMTAKVDAVAGISLRPKVQNSDPVPVKVPVRDVPVVIQ